MERRVEPMHVEIPQGRLDDLATRLEQTRYAPGFDEDDGRYGLPRAVLREWVDAWTAFDWRAQEREINRFDHYRVVLHDVPVHFVRKAGVGPDPVPIVLTHGWPWTFWDWHAVIEPLADPGAHGGDPADAFEVIVPSVPGFAFSTPLTVPRIGPTEVADLWLELMRDVLGFDRFGAAGGDYGCTVSSELGHRHAQHLVGVHILGPFPLNIFSHPQPFSYGGANFGFSPPAVPPSDPAFTPTHAPRPTRSSHVYVHALEPATLADAMHDTPAGMMAWLLQRRRTWSDNGDDLLDVVSQDFLLTTFSLFWLTESFGSSIRSYFERVTNPWRPSHDRSPVVEAPTGVTFFDNDMTTGTVPRFWVPEYYNLVRATSHERGGHFSPAEAPDLVVEDIRATFRALR